MTVFVIHNIDRVDRRLSFEKELAGIDYEIVPAIMHEDPKTGCALSHKSVIRKAKDLGLEYVIIAEDDIGLLSWEYFLKGLNEVKDWELFFGGVYHGNTEPKGEYYAKVTDCCSTHLYAIHNSFYDTALDCPDGVHIDRYFAETSKKAYVSWPMVAIQKPSYSDICKKDVDYENLRKSRGLKLLGE